MRTDLPQLDADVFLTDGGLETTLIFDDGIDLPDFAAFTLVDDDAGRAALVRYFERTPRSPSATASASSWRRPTWRASADWAARQGLRHRASSIRLNQ